MKDFKIYELDDTILAIMIVYDDTGNRNTLLIGDNNKETKDIIKMINSKDKHCVREMFYSV